jgi:hypothetical protein
MRHSMLTVTMGTLLLLAWFASFAEAAAATVAYWSFEQGSGVSFVDASTRSNRGTLVNGLSYTTDVHTTGSGVYSVLFDGTNDIAVIPSSDSLRPRRITVEAWVKPRPGSRVIVGKQLGTACCVNSYQLELNPFRFQLTDTAGQPHLIGAGEPSVDEWHHIAGTWDGSTMRLYLDGVEIASGPFSGTIGYDSNPVLIGGEDDGAGVPGGHMFSGAIDEVRITNVALEPHRFLP